MWSSTMPLTVLNVGYPLAVVSRHTAGGAEQVLASLDQALVKAGHRSIVVAPAGSEVHGSLYATSLPQPPLDCAATAWAWEQQRQSIGRVVTEFPIDVIHMHGIDFHRYLAPTHVPTLVTLHLPPSWYPENVFQGSHSDARLVCVSRSQAAQCPPEAEIYAIVENGVPLGVFSLTEKQDYVVALGRICPEKGFHLALDAATQAGLPLILAGMVFGYSAHEQYWNQEIRPRLTGRHRFIGSVGPEEKRKLLGAARCLVIPSLVDETSSLVAMESMAAGTPVVALRRGALTEIVEHGRTGFLVHRPEELPGAMLAAQDLNPEHCRARAETLFSCERMTARYLSLYRELASERSRDRMIDFCSVNRAA
jgi:glycosyltransferase involved in cell wall biosynthesis